MSIFRTPYEKHDYKGGLDRGLVYFLLNKYFRKGWKVLEPFVGGKVVKEVTGELGIELEQVNFPRENARDLSKWEAGAFDGVIAHPPYWKAIKYSEEKADLSNVEEYGEFLKQMGEIMVECSRVIKTGGWLILISGDYRSGGVLYPIHAELIGIGKNIKTLTLRDYVIWELSATGTPFLGTEWMIMVNWVIIWQKTGGEDWWK